MKNVERLHAAHHFVNAKSCQYVYEHLLRKKHSVLIFRYFSITMSASGSNNNSNWHYGSSSNEQSEREQQEDYEWNVRKRAFEDMGYDDWRRGRPHQVSQRERALYVMLCAIISRKT